MNQTLFSLPLRDKRDAMLARQRARQLAGLLGFDAQEQAEIAAGVFAVSWQVLNLQSPFELCFRIDREKLQVAAQVSSSRPRDGEIASAQSVLCLDKALPERSKIAPEDLSWAIGKLDQLTPARMYEEVYRLNQELLATLHELQLCQDQLAMMKTEKPSAA